MKLKPNQFVAYLADAEGNPIMVVDANDNPAGPEPRKTFISVEGDGLLVVSKMTESLKDAITQIAKYRKS